MPAFSRTIPLLVYDDIPAAHDFLVKAFGFEPGFVDRGPDGEARHGEVHVGDTTIWMHRVTSEHGLGSPLEVRATSGIVIYVDDVDAHYERARAARAQIDGPPADRPYGQREYGARDVEGHRWWFATPIPITAK